jgi:hypothetical protein
MEVAAFAGTLKAGDFRAVNVAREEVHSEDASFWLCVLLEDAFQATTPITFAGEAFEVGFYLVKIQYLEFNDFDAVGRRRRYRSSSDERMMNVNCSIRGQPIKLTTASAPQTRSQAASAATQYYYLPKEECGRIIDSAEIQDFDFEVD